MEAGYNTSSHQTNYQWSHSQPQQTPTTTPAAAQFVGQQQQATNCGYGDNNSQGMYHHQAGQYDTYGAYQQNSEPYNLNQQRTGQWVESQQKGDRTRAPSTNASMPMYTPSEAGNAASNASSDKPPPPPYRYPESAYGNQTNNGPQFAHPPPPQTPSYYQHQHPW